MGFKRGPYDLNYIEIVIYHCSIHLNSKHVDKVENTFRIRFLQLYPTHLSSLAVGGSVSVFVCVCVHIYTHTPTRMFESPNKFHLSVLPSSHWKAQHRVCESGTQKKEKKRQFKMEESATF